MELRNATLSTITTTLVLLSQVVLAGPGQIGSAETLSSYQVGYPSMKEDDAAFVGKVAINLYDVREGQFDTGSTKGFTIFVPGGFRFDSKKTVQSYERNLSLNREEGNRLTVEIPALAGELPGWNTTDDLCRGEEHWHEKFASRFNGKYSKESVTAYALGRASNRCATIGGKVITGREKIESFSKTSLRTLTPGNVIPALRQCFTAYVTVTCDVSSKTQDVKNLAKEFKAKFPNEAVVSTIDAFTNGL